VRRVALLALPAALVAGLLACDRPPAVVLFVGDSLTTFPPKCDYPRQWVARHPSIVVIALGTNDARTGRPFGVIVNDLRALYDQVEAADGPHGHPKAYIATVPPVYDPPEGDPIGAAALQTKIKAMNQFMRLRFPSDRLIDFDSWMPAEWTADVMNGPRDGVHVGCGGHRLRAEHVDAKLVL
jgi:lysophospholipase L1-like esterase